MYRTAHGTSGVPAQSPEHRQRAWHLYLPRCTVAVCRTTPLPARLLSLSLPLNWDWAGASWAHCERLAHASSFSFARGGACQQFTVSHRSAYFMDSGDTVDVSAAVIPAAVTVRAAISNPKVRLPTSRERQ